MTETIDDLYTIMNLFEPIVVDIEALNNRLIEAEKVFTEEAEAKRITNAGLNYEYTI